MIRTTIRRSGLTLAELLVASTVTALVVTALGVFARAVMDGWASTSATTQATHGARVVYSRISHKVATSRQVLKMSDALRAMTDMDQVLVVWERDAEPGDVTPGQPNLIELVIYGPSKKQPGELWEMRPQVDPALVAPLSDPALFFTWIERFRSGQDIVQLPVVLHDQLDHIRFDVEEFNEPQGIAALVQQNVQVMFSLVPPGGKATFFVASAVRRYKSS